MNRVRKCSLLIIALSLTACNEKETVYKTEIVYVDSKCSYSEWCGGLPDVPVEPPVIEPIKPIEPVEPETPIEPPIEPPKLPQFHSEQMVEIAPGEWLITQDGNVWLKWNSEVEYFHDWTPPEWEVDYKYQTYIEILITNGSESLCVRYNPRARGFGMGEARCLWSDARESVSLEGIRASYYGFYIVETRFLVSGVKGLSVGVLIW